MSNGTELVLVLSLFSISLSITLLIILLKWYRDLNMKYEVLVKSLKMKNLKSYIKSIEERSRRRIRRRYLIFEVIALSSYSKVSQDYLSKLIKDSYRELFGTLDTSLSGISLITYNNELRRGVIKFRSGYKAKLLLSLALAQYRGRIILRPIRTTGTLRKALKYMKA